MKTAKFLYYILIILWSWALFRVCEKAHLPISFIFTGLSLAVVLIVSLVDFLENVIKLKHVGKLPKIFGMHPALFLFFLSVVGLLLATVEVYVFSRLGIIKNVGP